MEALSATGLRSIRYAKEIPNIEQIYANDLSAEAIEQIRANIKHNELSEELIFPSHRDAVYFSPPLPIRLLVRTTSNKGELGR